MAALLPAASDQGHGAKVAGPLGRGGAAVAGGDDAGGARRCVAGVWLWVPLVAAARRRRGRARGWCAGAWTG